MPIMTRLWNESVRNKVIAGLIVAAILAICGAVGTWVVANFASFVSVAQTLLAVAGQYSTMGVLCGFFLVIIGVIVRIRALNARLSNLERRTIILLDESVSGEQILADLGKALAYRPRHLVTQGGSTAKPSWEFDLVLSLDTKENSSVSGLLRTSGGSKFNELTEEQKNEWQKCKMTLGQDKSIILERPLTDKWAGNTQNFKSKSGPTQTTIKDKTAIVWEGTWSGAGTNNDHGAFIVYLD